jgi:hypothetical protein
MRTLPHQWHAPWETEGGPRRGRAHELHAAPARSPLASGDRTCGATGLPPRSSLWLPRAPAGRRPHKAFSSLVFLAVEKGKGEGRTPAAGGAPLSTGRRGTRRTCSVRRPPRPPHAQRRRAPSAAALAVRSEGEGVKCVRISAPLTHSTYMRLRHTHSRPIFWTDRIKAAGRGVLYWAEFASWPARQFLGFRPI